MSGAGHALGGPAPRVGDDPLSGPASSSDSDGATERYVLHGPKGSIGGALTKHFS
jgi:hypothetical protein